MRRGTRTLRASCAISSGVAGGGGGGRDRRGSRSKEERDREDWNDGRELGKGERELGKGEGDREELDLEEEEGAKGSRSKRTSRFRGAAKGGFLSEKSLLISALLGPTPWPGPVQEVATWVAGPQASRAVGRPGRAGARLERESSGRAQRL